MGAECSKLRQPMRAIFALSRAQLIFLVVTRSRELSRECHVTKHKTPARSNFPLSNFENSGTIQFSSSNSTSRGLCPKFKKKGRTLTYIHVFRRLVDTSRAPQSAACLGDMAKLGYILTKHGCGCPAGTGWHPETGTPSKVWSRALICWKTAISKSSFTKNQGEPPLIKSKTCYQQVC